MNLLSIMLRVGLLIFASVRSPKQSHTQQNTTCIQGGFFKRSQCEGCSIIIYLMALYDYDLKCIEGTHIKDLFLSRLFEMNPIDELSKLMKSLSDFHDVTINFLRQKV